MLFRMFSKRKRPVQKVGILYVCTGKYHIFWNDFYKSAQKYFCKNSEVHYFVFSDYLIDRFNNELVNHFVQPKLGWPYDTLKRFHLFLEQREALERMDYLFFFNANMIFQKKIKEGQILPSKNRSGLVSVLHSGFYDHKNIPPFEDNKDSVAYTEANANLNYFQGCLSGGRLADYLRMAEEIKKMVDIDLEKSIVGKWWDESYMNKYFLQHEPIALHPGFAYPQKAKLPFHKMILQLDKSLYGGHSFLREVHT